MILNSQEEYFIEILRGLKPFERIEIVADKQGVANTYLVTRSQKIIVSKVGINEVK